MHARHIDRVGSLTKRDLDLLFDAATLKEGIFDVYSDALRSKILALYFATPSFRTRLSFTAAFLRLGGNTLDVPDSIIGNISDGDLSDIAQQLSFYADYVVVRTSSAAEWDLLVRHSRVPVISAGHGLQAHPTTAIALLFSIYEHIGRLDNLTILVIAKLPKRGVNSFIEGLANYSPNTIIIRTPPTRRLSSTIEARLTAAGRNPLTYVSHLNEIEEPGTIDAVFIDDARADFQPIREDEGYWVPEITRSFVSLLSPRAFITSGLPRTEMTPHWLDDDPRSHYIAKSLNSLYIRAGIFLLLEGQLK